MANIATPRQEMDLDPDPDSGLSNHPPPQHKL
jgi:hypothetical protein